MTGEAGQQRQHVTAVGVGTAGEIRETSCCHDFCGLRVTATRESIRKGHYRERQ